MYRNALFPKWSGVTTPNRSAETLVLARIGGGHLLTPSGSIVVGEFDFFSPHKLLLHTIQLHVAHDKKRRRPLTEGRDGGCQNKTMSSLLYSNVGSNGCHEVPGSPINSPEEGGAPAVSHRCEADVAEGCRVPDEPMPPKSSGSTAPTAPCTKSYSVGGATTSCSPEQARRRRALRTTAVNYKGTSHHPFVCCFPSAWATTLALLFPALAA